MKTPSDERNRFGYQSPATVFLFSPPEKCLDSLVIVIELKQVSPLADLFFEKKVSFLELSY